MASVFIQGRMMQRFQGLEGSTGVEGGIHKEVQ